MKEQLLFGVTHTLDVLAGPVPDTAPNGAGLPASGAIEKILSWLMWGSLIVCAMGAIVAGGAMGIGHVSERPHVAARGKTGLIWALIGAVVIGAAIPLVNAAFAAA